MKKYFYKMTAPVIVALCIIAYYMAGALIVVKIHIPNVVKIIALIVSILLTIVIVIVLIERIKEIRSGEEDDISKY